VSARQQTERSFVTRSLAGRLVMCAPVAVAVALAAVLVSGTYRPVLLSGAGIAQGALIAAIALGVVLTYRGSGVVNIANGAIAMYAAYTYSVLRADGDLFVPPMPNPFAVVEGIVHWFDGGKLRLPHLPTRISFGPNMQFWPALLITLLVCVLLGLLLHLAIFRRLSGAPPLAKVVASVGVFLVLQAVVLRRFGTTPKTVKALPFVGKRQVSLGIVTLTAEQLFVAVFVVVCAVGLAVVFRRTRFGLATRAAAENERGAMFLGYSPDRLAGINWVLSTVVTGLLGVFVAAVNSNVDPSVIPALIVPALTAALVGGFTSFGITTVVAFLLGMQVPLIQTLGVRESWFPHAGTFAIPGVETILPLVLLVTMLFVRGRSLPSRGAVTDDLPSAPEPTTRGMWLAASVLTSATAAFALFVLSPAYRDALSTTLIGVILCLSVVVATGYVGQISLAPITFAGISAFTVSHLTIGFGWAFPLPMLAGAFVAMGIGVLVAIPALRIRGVSLAIVTLAVAIACDRALFANENVNGGLKRALVTTPQLIQQSRATSYAVLGRFTAGDGLQPNPMTALFCLGVAAVLCVCVGNLRRSATGRRMLAVRANERGGAAAGVNVAQTKALAFGVSAFIAGLGGAVIAYRAGAATKTQFSYDKSLLVFAAAYLGGLSRVSGAVVGGILVSGGLLFTFLGETLHIDDHFTLLLGGLGLTAAAVAAPGGIVGQIGSIVGRGRTLIARVGS
jgi:branched-chain amino acid transport system permease protein